MEFTIDDHVAEILELPKIVRKMLDVCEALPDGMLITTRRLAELTGYAYRGAIAGHTTDKAIQPFRARTIYHGAQANFFGNARTIAAYKEARGG